MKKIGKYLVGILLVSLVSLGLVGCSEQIPQGHVGKILTKNGFNPETFPPSKVWVDNGPFTLNPDTLILVETTTRKYNEPITVLLQDKLELTAEIVFRCRINTAEKVLNSVFNDIKLNDEVITTDEVYNIYGKMVVLNTARDIISKYNVDEVNQNYGRITAELYQAIKPKLASLPIDISDVTVGNIQYPTMVTAAIIKAKERRMLIEQEEANVQIALTKAKGQEEVAKAMYNVKLMEAKQVRDYNQMISSGLTVELLKLKELELETFKVQAHLAEVEQWDGKMPQTQVNGNSPVMLMK